MSACVLLRIDLETTYKLFESVINTNCIQRFGSVAQYSVCFVVRTVYNATNVLHKRLKVWLPHPAMFLTNNRLYRQFNPFSDFKCNLLGSLSKRKSSADVYQTPFPLSSSSPPCARNHISRRANRTARPSFRLLHLNSSSNSGTSYRFEFVFIWGMMIHSLSQTDPPPQPPTSLSSSPPAI